jgi:hypothetical protein
MVVAGAPVIVHNIIRLRKDWQHWVMFVLRPNTGSLRKRFFRHAVYDLKAVIAG